MRPWEKRPRLLCKIQVVALKFTVTVRMDECHAAASSWSGEARREPLPPKSLAALLRQRISYQAVAVRLIVVVASSGSDYHKLLAGLLPLKRHRRRMPTGGYLCHPEFLARVLVERSESAVVSRCYENQSTCRDDGSSQVGRSCGRDTLGNQFIDHSKCCLPAESAGVEIDRGERPPGRLLTRILFGIPKASIWNTARNIRG